MLLAGRSLWVGGITQKGGRDLSKMQPWWILLVAGKLPGKVGKALWFVSESLDLAGSRVYPLRQSKSSET